MQLSVTDRSRKISKEEEKVAFLGTYSILQSSMNNIHSNSQHIFIKIDFRSFYSIALSKCKNKACADELFLSQ
jgi:hypothetical protein